MVADEGMQVVVRPGACLIEGATGYETEDRTMVVQAAAPEVPSRVSEDHALF